MLGPIMSFKNSVRSSSFHLAAICLMARVLSRHLAVEVDDEGSIVDSQSMLAGTYN